MLSCTSFVLSLSPTQLTHVNAFDDDDDVETTYFDVNTLDEQA